MKMNDKTYDILVWFAQVVLPAIGTLYSALAVIWGFPYGEEIVGTIIAIDTFLGSVLRISKTNYEYSDEIKEMEDLHEDEYEILEEGE